MQNSHITGIGSLELNVKDTVLCEKFLIDLGLEKLEQNVFRTLDQSELKIRQSNCSSVNSVSWNIDIDEEVFYHNLKDKITFLSYEKDTNSLGCCDPSGIKLIFQKKQKTAPEVLATAVNGWNSISRINTPVMRSDKVLPVEISHLVLETSDISSSEEFYKNLGFVVSDRLLGRGVFLRSSIIGGHHDLFLIQSDKSKLHHAAFAVKDIYDLFDAGKNMESKGWKTAKGPGRHNISSAFFWYFDSPLDAMIEYTVNEDYLTDKWECRDILYSSDLFSESFVSR